MFCSTGRMVGTYENKRHVGTDYSLGQPILTKPFLISDHVVYIEMLIMLELVLRKAAARTIRSKSLKLRRILGLPRIVNWGPPF
jgi:hypothetical protein